MRWHLEIDRLGLDQLDRLLAQKPGDEILLDLRWRRHDRRKGRGRIRTDRHRDLHAIALDLRNDLPRNRSVSRSRPAGRQGHQVDRLGSIRGRGPQTVAQLLGGVLLALPVHAGRVPVINLHPVHADIALARLGVTRDHARQRDEWAAVLRPGRQHRQL